jgi:hypothetical protein
MLAHELLRQAAQILAAGPGEFVEILHFDLENCPTVQSADPVLLLPTGRRLPR